jgi:SNF2 family DNA or RNA helicase
LVFSQFTTVLKEIETEFVKKKITTLYLDGKTKSQERQKLTQKFNEDSSISVFLISLKAGGTGLNLTGADTVIHFDPWWNPSIENQASDRAYRMGQNKNVQIIKLICKNTIEEKIVELQNRKQNLINDVLNNEEKAISNLTEQELLNLFDIK